MLFGVWFPGTMSPTPEPFFEIATHQTSIADIWDFSTFGPDLIVGLLTALVVGLILLWAERRATTRGRAELITQQQESTVRTGAQLLQDQLLYLGERSDDLLPSGTNLNRLRSMVLAVPSEPSLREVFAYQWLVEIATLYEQLEVASEGARLQLTRLSVAYPPAIKTLLFDHVRERAGSPPDYSFSWHAYAAAGALPVTLASQLDQNVDLRAALQGYFHTAHVLAGYRSVFLDAWHGLSAEAHFVNIESARGAPHGPFKRRQKEHERRKQYLALTARFVQEAEDKLNRLRGGC